MSTFQLIDTDGGNRQSHWIYSIIQSAHLYSYLIEQEKWSGGWEAGR